MSGSMFQFSTAISDGVLCIVALLGAAAVADPRLSRRLAAMGFVQIALAAALGVLHYGLWPDIEPWHRLASAAAAMVGMPMVALGLLLETRNDSSRLLGLCLLALLSVWALLHASPAYRLFMGLCTQLLWLVIAWHWFSRNRLMATCAVLSVVFTLFAGLVLGNQGVWHGIPRVDLLHYLLAAAQAVLIAALLIERQVNEDGRRHELVLGASHG